MIWNLKWKFKSFVLSILDARQQTIPKAFPGYGLVFAETSGFEATTRRGFFEELFLAI